MYEIHITQEHSLTYFYFRHFLKKLHTFYGGWGGSSNILEYQWTGPKGLSSPTEKTQTGHAGMSLKLFVLKIWQLLPLIPWVCVWCLHLKYFHFLCHSTLILSEIGSENQCWKTKYWSFTEWQWEFGFENLGIWKPRVCFWQRSTKQKIKKITKSWTDTPGYLHNSPDSEVDIES